MAISTSSYPYGKGALDPIMTAEQFSSLFTPIDKYSKTDHLCRLVLVRHGQSQGNKNKVNIGSGESPLTEEGKRQAYAIGQKLANWDFQFSKVVCSGLSRTEETAYQINEAWKESKNCELPQPFAKEPAINERFCGATLQGNTVTEAQYKPYKEREKEDLSTLHNFQELFEYQMRHADGSKVEDMESLAMAYERASRALLKIAKENMGKDVLVNTHVGCMRALIVGLASIGHAKNEQPVSLSIRKFELPNATCLVLESDGTDLYFKASTPLTFTG